MPWVFKTTEIDQKKNATWSNRVAKKRSVMEYSEKSNLAFLIAENIRSQAAICKNLTPFRNFNDVKNDNDLRDENKNFVQADNPEEEILDQDTIKAIDDILSQFNDTAKKNIINLYLLRMHIQNKDWYEIFLTEFGHFPS